MLRAAFQLGSCSAGALALYLLGAFSGAPLAKTNQFVIGVGTHLTGGKRPIERSVAMLSTGGTVSLRDDATWAAVEQRRGELHIPVHWDELVNEARRRGIEPLLILAYGNKFYDGGGKPHSPEAIAAFTRYAAFVAAHFKGRVSRYEIWNEWEHTTGNTLPGTPEDYVRLVRSVYPAVKKVNPEAEVLVGAVGPRGIRGGYLRRIIDLGVLEFADSLSLHTYVHCRRFGSGPDGWAAWMHEIAEELRKVSPKAVPFYITEMGWPTHRGRCGVSPETQAEYLKRMFSLARMMPFIKGVWWYDFQDDGSDSENQEHNFGLVRPDFSEKPAFRALQTLSTADRNQK